MVIMLRSEGDHFQNISKPQTKKKEEWKFIFGYLDLTYVLRLYFINKVNSKYAYLNFYISCVKTYILFFAKKNYSGQVGWLN